MTSVIVVDRHAVVRAGLVRLLHAADDLLVVGEAGEWEAGMALSDLIRPTVVLVGPSCSTCPVAPARAAQMPAGTRLVALVDEPGHEAAAAEPGTIEYLSADSNPEELVGAVRGGRAPMPATAACPPWHGPSGAKTAAGLTARERQILTLLGRGSGNRQIAHELGIRETTVKAHLTRVFLSIGVTSRTQAALWAHFNGLAA
ncbi:MAG TPA: response regulator transcription factor [Dermatophilaceae bacterium]|nr:response regulator transcription factor [Dermatophilaceae bacterium]